MKILVVCQYYYPENFTITNVCESLVKKGHRVDVLTAKPNYGYDRIVEGYENIDFEVINGVNVHRVDVVAKTKKRLATIHNYLSFWKNSKKWVRKCREDYDVIFSMSLSPVTMLSAGVLYKKKHPGVKYVVHCVDLWPESTVVTKAVKKDSLFYNILYKWSQKLYSNVDEILVGSPSFEEYFKDVLNIKKTPIHFVPQCSLVENYNGENVDLGNHFNVVYCGNLGTIQLVELMCESMMKIKNDDIHFHIIGPGVKVPTLKKQIQELGLENRVTYYGPKPFKEACKYISGADLLYASLSKEGYVGKTIPNKLTMYLTFNKPIVAVVKGDGELVSKEAKGVLLAEEDPSSVADKIEEIYRLDETKRKEMGDNNLNYYRTHFSSDYVTNKIEESLLRNSK